ncbi:Zinc-binding dehydrogenase [Ceratobasidium sp. AG-Ba]|nr:Zinc-binding dehydrogenase [Ceratobasidium sp. AG-Ba]
MADPSGTYLAYTYTSPTSTLTTLEASRVPHRPPGKGEIKVRICASALNPVDVQLAGWTGPLKSAIDWISGVPTNAYRPQNVPGTDLSGVIAAVGEDVDNWRVGDEVFGLNLSLTGNGTNQEYVHLPATHALGVKVLILGASGGTGIIGVQMAKHFGAHVVAVCSGKNAEFVKAHGADELIDYTTQDIVSAAISRGPYTVVYDCVGGTKLIPHLTILLARKPSLEPASPGVYITIVGDKTSREQIGGFVTYLSSPAMMTRTFMGALGLGPRYYCVDFTTGEEEVGALLKLSAEQQIKPVIDGKAFGRSQVRDAYAKLESGRAKGKVVVDWERD